MGAINVPFIASHYDHQKQVFSLISSKGMMMVNSQWVKVTGQIGLFPTHSHHIWQSF
jgi:hypothetical protein